MTRLKTNSRFGLATLLLVLGLLVPTSAPALDAGYACRADAEAVFRAVSEAAQRMSQWRSLRIIQRDRTIKAVVRGRRNIAVPIWIQVRLPRPELENAKSELHVLWEQSMEPVNYPDLKPFMDAFGDRQQARELGCIAIGTDVGL